MFTTVDTVSGFNFNQTLSGHYALSSFAWCSISLYSHCSNNIFGNYRLLCFGHYPLSSSWFYWVSILLVCRPGWFWYKTSKVADWHPAVPFVFWPYWPLKHFLDKIANENFLSPKISHILTFMMISINFSTRTVFGCSGSKADFTEAILLLFLFCSRSDGWALIRKLSD